jgi:hypothetical protein
MTTRFLLLATALLTVNYPVRSVTPKEPGPPFHIGVRASAQQDGWVTIKTEAGILFVWNARGLYFTLTVNGKEISPVDDPEHIFFTVDGKILQIQVAAIDSFAPGAREKKLDDRSILAAHRDWEAKYIEEMLQSKLAVRTFNAKLSSGGDASMWQFDMPESLHTTAKKQLYLTIVRNDYVLMLNSEATDAISDAEGRKFLLETIASLKISPTPIDAQKLSESIRKGERQ